MQWRYVSLAVVALCVADGGTYEDDHPVSPRDADVRLVAALRRNSRVPGRRERERV
jgi:hypothetical protein